MFGFEACLCFTFVYSVNNSPVDEFLHSRKRKRIPSVSTIFSLKVRLMQMVIAVAAGWKRICFKLLSEDLCKEATVVIEPSLMLCVYSGLDTMCLMMFLSNHQCGKGPWGCFHFRFHFFNLNR